MNHRYHCYSLLSFISSGDHLAHVVEGGELLKETEGERGCSRPLSFSCSLSKVNIPERKYCYRGVYKPLSYPPSWHSERQSKFLSLANGTQVCKVEVRFC